MWEELSQIPTWALILLGLTLYLQSSWLFKDGQKHCNHPWLWGIWGMIQFPTPLIVYLLVVRKIHKKKSFR